tara:strand:+ start:221 stop:799 length:579 start_codon:yes stop_codon:yes gene_type:complete
MIAILKYNAGNIKSVENTLLRLGYPCVITDDISMLKGAEKVILPGVGEAKSAMDYLKRKGLDQVIPNLNQPVLGICLGLQLMCSKSEEGNTPCLGIFSNKVLRFTQKGLVPHMGWNNINGLNSKLFKDIKTDSDVYFVHSYYAELTEHTTATCDYIVPFSAALEKDNFYATQFHPEKSADLGEKIVKNFLEL